jgi:hypothetical protein
MVGSLIYFPPIFYSVRILMTFFIELFMYELIQRLSHVYIYIYIYIELIINFYTCIYIIQRQNILRRISKATQNEKKLSIIPIGN